VCDAFDAPGHDRPYRTRRSTAEALAVLRAGAGTQWDPEAVDLLASELPMIQHLGAA
jgi:HD-GYP domain-containing protein (c-di-GMP phosphodiesterase class II)